MWAAGRPILFDYDDAIFHMYDDNAPPSVRLLLDDKLGALLRRCAGCCCGNDYLAAYARRFCANTIVLPTVVDTDRYRPAPRSPGPLTIGWIGSPSTWGQVRPVLPIIEQLCKDGEVAFRAVGAGKAAEQDRFAGFTSVDWDEVSEVAEIQRMDIGIMPLLDNPFERGKSGYKLVQYMACGLPVVASPVGVNSEIVTDDCGILADGADQWARALRRLLGDPALRGRLGQAGHERVEALYSLRSQAPRLIGMLRGVAGEQSSSPESAS